MNAIGKNFSNKAESQLCHFAHYEIRILKASINRDEIKRLRGYISQNLEQYRNIYQLITIEANNERTLNLIRSCAPLMYPFKRIADLTYPTFTWQKQVLVIYFDNENPYESAHRLYYSALEVIFMRASAEELRGILAYLVDDTKELVTFNVKDWPLKPPGDFPPK